MVIAFCGYLAANALSGCTRAWTLGQGHCVAAIEAVNALTGDVSESQRGRYDRSEAGKRARQRFLQLRHYAGRASSRPARKPRKPAYGGRALRGRLSRICEPAICPHAFSRRTPRRLPK